MSDFNRSTRSEQQSNGGGCGYCCSPGMVFIVSVVISIMTIAMNTSSNESYASLRFSFATTVEAAMVLPTTATSLFETLITTTNVTTTTNEASLLSSEGSTLATLPTEESTVQQKNVQATTANESSSSTPEISTTMSSSLPSSVTSTLAHEFIFNDIPTDDSSSAISSSTINISDIPSYYTKEQYIAKLRRNQRIIQITKPYLNETTFGYHHLRFYSGYRNQMMSFNALIMWGLDMEKHRQVLINSMRFKDTYGSNKDMSFNFLFDVEHWNSFYPRLPRLVSCDPTIHTDYDCVRNQYRKHTNHSSTAPYPRMGNMNHLFMMFRRYTKQRGPFTEKGQPFPHPIHKLIMQGALRPHPDLISIIDDKLSSLQQKNMAGSMSTQQQQGQQGHQHHVPYFTLHARVEPDMQHHVVCQNEKEKNLTRIFQMLEETFPDPPAPHMFLPINRQMLESEGYVNTQDVNKTNWIAVENLRALNHATKFGLWNGKVSIFEFGANALNGTKYERRPSTAGALVNYHIALNSTIFIGTEISSYSYDLLFTRFYNNNLENYKYLPDGIHRWTDENTTALQPFVC